MAASRDISSRRPAAAGRGKNDRLSELPDGVLGNILSFLPMKEAGRAAVLSQRWRHMFANVHTLLFEQGVVRHQDDDFTFYVESQERRSLNGDFLDEVSAALLCRRRCGGAAPNASLRAFRVAYDDFHRWDGPMLEMWLAHVLPQSSQALDLGLVFQRARPCRHGSFEYWYRQNDTCGEGSQMPRQIFSCAVLHYLRLGCCRLRPPEDVQLPALVTLHLVKVDDSNDTIQKIIDSCPRLADLMLEECATLQRVSVLDRRLRRFALRCCHGAVRVTLDASELTTLDYKGAVPPESLLVLHGAPRIASSTIGVCGAALSKEEEFLGFRRLLDNFVRASRHLHLQSLLLGCSVESEFFPGFPSFSSLQHLELTGSLDNYGVIQAVARIMEQTPSLEVLTLFLTPVAKKQLTIRTGIWGRNIMTRTMDPEEEYIDEEHHEQEEDHEQVPINVQGAPNLSACLCLRRQVRQINLVHYTSNDVQRTLAKTLLCNALVLQELCVVFPKGRYARQMTQMEKIKGWVANKSANMMFL